MMPIVSGNKMDIKQFGGISLFRPRLESEVLARNEAEKQLREGYTSGKYTDAKKINEIIQSRFAHFYKLLHAEIPKSASRHLMEFLLGQYDATVEINGKSKMGELSGVDAAYWQTSGPIIRRALKHLAEIVTMLAPSEAPVLGAGALPLNLDTIVICGELLVELYMISDQTHGLHPNETELEIRPEGELDYFILTVQNFERFAEFQVRINRDTARQGQYFGEEPLRYDLDYQASVLDPGFNAAFGFGYKDAIQALMRLIEGATVDAGSFDVPFASRATMVDFVRQNTGWPPPVIERLIAGFSLTKAQLEGRVLYKPKQEYRALRRGFFEMPHPTGPHLTWSRKMVRECLFELMKGTLFQRCPPEWAEDPVKQVLARLQKKAGDWFEDQVDGNMKKQGFIGLASVKDAIGVGASRIPIPGPIGELDFLGYLTSDRILAVLEDKMVDGGFEPAYFRDDASSFVTGKKPYADQLRRKVGWVRDNLAAVCKALSSQLPGNPIIDPTRVAGALVTLHPTYASYLIPDYPCVPLTELMDGLKEKGRWPYDFGVSNV